MGIWGLWKKMLVTTNFKAISHTALYNLCANVTKYADRLALSISHCVIQDEIGYAFPLACVETCNEYVGDLLH